MNLQQWSRFWEKVEKTPRCWFWVAGHNGHYGHLRSRVENRDYLAHRLIYETCIGPIPEGLEIDHECRNTLCVNPSHLRVATRLQNMLNSSHSIATFITRNHCSAGHEYTPGNTYMRGNTRSCRTCHARRERERRARHGRVIQSDKKREKP